LIAWDGPKCRKCGYELHYHVKEIPKPPKRLLEALSWQSSFVVI
jgi:predicted Zn-ribbon and HTH transcriptional regulator